MSSTSSQITSVSMVCSIVGSGADRRRHQSSASLAVVRGIHRWLVNSPHKWPVTWKMFLFDDVIMNNTQIIVTISFVDSITTNAIKYCNPNCIWYSKLCAIDVCISWTCTTITGIQNLFLTWVSHHLLITDCLYPFFLYHIRGYVITSIINWGWNYLFILHRFGNG